MSKTNLESQQQRKAAKCRLFNHKRDQDILKELQTEPPLEKINNYKSKWIHPASSAQVKNVWSRTFSLPYAFMVWTGKILHYLQQVP
jgi:hypothetical protein